MDKSTRYLQNTVLASLYSSLGEGWGAVVRMLRSEVFLVYIVLFSCTFVSMGVSANEVIHNFSSDIVVNASGEMTVTETIDVESEGYRIRHGIYRDFPITRKEDDGGVTNTGFDVLSATLDGEPTKTRIVRKSDHIRVYLGNARGNVSLGSHRFVLRYRTNRQIRFFEDHDEIYWNVTGTRWEFPIQHAVSIVHLPEGAVATDVTSFTGAYGERGQAARSDVRSDGRVVRTETTAALNRMEGLTIAVAFPKGAVTPPSLFNRLVWYISDHPSNVAALLGLVIVSAIYWLIYRHVGPREKREMNDLAGLELPIDFSPALAHYISRDGKITSRGLVAAILSLGIKGYVTIDQSTDSWTMSRIGKNAEGLPTEEAAILEYLDKQGGILVVSKDNRKALKALRTAFKTAMQDENREVFYRSHGGWMLLGIWMAYLAAFIPNMLSIEPMGQTALWVGLIPCGLMLFVCMMASPLDVPFSEGRYFAKSLGISLAVSCLWWLIWGGAKHTIDIFSALSMLALPTAFWTFALQLERTTETGWKFKAKVGRLRNGMRQYSGPGRTEVEWSQSQALWPYAFALEVESEFQRAQESMLRFLNEQESSSTPRMFPWWAMSFSATGGEGPIIDACNSLNSTLSACMASSSSGSGSGFSSGGGFSGGGGGGGGGGW